MRVTYAVLKTVIIALLCYHIITGTVYAQEQTPSPHHAANSSTVFAVNLLWVALALTIYTVFASFAARLKQPKVLGGLIGGLGLAIATIWAPALKQEAHGFIAHLAELGAMMMLFMAGLEANLHTVIRDAKTGWKVATVGVIAPLIGAFIYTFTVQGVSWQVALFQGGVFTATSVGITAAVLGELGVMQKDYARIIISAAVIDDIMGLVVLALCQACNAPGEIHLMTVLSNIGLALLFVGVVPVAGHLAAKRIINGLYRFSPENQEAIILAWMAFYGAASIFFGLAPIVGAYFAGVAIEEAYFQEEPRAVAPHYKPIEHYLKGLVGGFGPIFFIYAGSIVDPRIFTNASVLLTGLLFTIIAMIGKLAAGLVVPKGNRLIIGVGMIPRGEVGIIFAAMGLQSGILTQELFGASMIMVILSTLVTPPMLNATITRSP